VSVDSGAVELAECAHEVNLYVRVRGGRIATYKSGGLEEIGRERARASLETFALARRKKPRKLGGPNDRPIRF
jgi:hypothetical protein